MSSFVSRRARALGPARAKLMVGALRSFLSFLCQRGDVDLHLAGAVPRVADWRLSSLPKALPTADVERVLEACPRSTVTERRNYAVLLLLARLGLRAGEVVGLTLDDIDWDTAELTVRGKGGRRDRLPLPREVGKALVDYLRDGRPHPCSSRRVFLRARAPYRGFSSSVAICTIVRDALERAGVDSPRKGAHLFRHSLAMRILREGGSLSEIGEVLRHRLVDTTAIYAKVDLVRLRELARPWPVGGEA